LLAHRGALAPALDDLQIGATAGGLLAEIHGGEPGADSILVRTLSACSPNKSTTIKAKRGTTISRSLPIAPNHINGLRRTPMRQLSKISQTARRAWQIRPKWCFCTPKGIARGASGGDLEKKWPGIASRPPASLRLALPCSARGGNQRAVTVASGACAPSASCARPPSRSFASASSVARPHGDHHGDRPERGHLSVSLRGTVGAAL